MTQSIAESYIEEGLMKGQLLAYRETLRRQLASRFGPLPHALLQRIETSADPARLQAALDQVLQIQSLDELIL